jgi:hypothetical protein
MRRRRHAPTAKLRAIVRAWSRCRYSMHAPARHPCGQLCFPRRTATEWPQCGCSLSSVRQRHWQGGRPPGPEGPSSGSLRLSGSLQWGPGAVHHTVHAAQVRCRRRAAPPGPTRGAPATRREVLAKPPRPPPPPVRRRAVCDCLCFTAKARPVLHCSDGTGHLEAMPRTIAIGTRRRNDRGGSAPADKGPLLEPATVSTSKCHFMESELHVILRATDRPPTLTRIRWGSSHGGIVSFCL